MKWYFMCILIGILLYILLNQINHFSVGNAYEISTWGIEDALPDTDGYTYVPMCDNILNHHKLPLNTKLKENSSNLYNCKYVDYDVGTSEYLPEYLSDLKLNLNSIHKRDTHDCKLECDEGVERSDFLSWEYAPLNVDRTKENKLDVDCIPVVTFYAGAHGSILVINNEINNTENDVVKNDIYENYYIKYPKIYLENSGISLVTIPRPGHDTVIALYLNDLAFNNKSFYNTARRETNKPYSFVQKFTGDASFNITRQPYFYYNTEDRYYTYQNPSITNFDLMTPLKISGFNKTLQSHFNIYKNTTNMIPVDKERFDLKLHKKNLQHDIVLANDLNYSRNIMKLNTCPSELMSLLLADSFNKIKLISMGREGMTLIIKYLRSLSKLFNDSSYFNINNLEIDTIIDYLNYERYYLSDYRSNVNQEETATLDQASTRFTNSDDYYMNSNNYKDSNENTNLLICKTNKNKILQIFFMDNSNNWDWVDISNLEILFYGLNENNCGEYLTTDDLNIPGDDIPDRQINTEWPILYYWSTLYYIHAYINFKSLKAYIDACNEGVAFDNTTYEDKKPFNKDTFINNTPRYGVKFYSKDNNPGFSSLQPNGTQKSLIGEYTYILDIDLLITPELDLFYRLFNTSKLINYIEEDSFHQKEVHKYNSGINDYELHLTSLLNGYDGPIGQNTEKDEYLKELKILQYNKTTLLSRSFSGDQILYRKHRNTVLLSDVVFYCKNIRLKFDISFDIQIYLHACLTLNNDGTNLKYFDTNNDNRFKLESFYYDPLNGDQGNYLKSGDVNIFDDSPPTYSTSEKNNDLETRYNDEYNIDEIDGGAVNWDIKYNEDDTTIGINLDVSGGIDNDTNSICKLPNKCIYHMDDWPPRMGIQTEGSRDSPYVVLTSIATMDLADPDTLSDGHSILMEEYDDNDLLDRPVYRLTEYIYNDIWDWKSDGRLGIRHNEDGNTKYKASPQKIDNMSYNVKCADEYEMILGSDNNFDYDNPENNEYKCGYLSDDQLNRLYTTRNSAKPNNSHLCKVENGIIDCSKPLTLRCSNDADILESAEQEYNQLLLQQSQQSSQQSSPQSSQQSSPQLTRLGRCLNCCSSSKI